MKRAAGLYSLKVHFVRAQYSCYSERIVRIYELRDSCICYFVIDVIFGIVELYVYGRLINKLSNHRIKGLLISFNRALEVVPAYALLCLSDNHNSKPQKH